MTIPANPAALIFDLDGTLLDTEPLYSIAVQRVLDDYGATYTPALKKRTMGGDSRVSAQTVIDEFSLPLTVDDYLARREVFLRELFLDCPEIEGAGHFVERAAKAGKTLGLATSSHQHLRDLKLGKRDWAAHFRANICGDHPDLIRGKPAPDIFLLCAQALGVDPAGCLAFEDSRNGIEAAKGAGMQVVAIRSPFVDDGDLGAAHHIINDFTEATGWLDDWLRQTA